jgi:hypothetical protein
VDSVNTLGAQVAKRVGPFGNGRRYVGAGPWALALAWLVDFLVTVFGVVIGIVALLLVDQQTDLGNGVLGLALFGLPFGVPLLYGLFYGNGRAVGAVLTGTRLVRLKDGGRLGFSAPWAMLVRILLLPLLIIASWVGAYAGFGASLPGSIVRVSLDIDASQRLWAAESAASPSW